MNYHSHDHRDEVRVVVSGFGRVTIDDKEYEVSTGDVITMKAGCKHTMAAITELKLVDSDR